MDKNIPSILLEEHEVTSVELNEENLSVEISNVDEAVDIKDISVATLPPTFPADFQKAPSSPKISALYQRKEAFKGFVLSKLSKKTSSVSDNNNVNSSDIERRTIFSGIKEKLTKKLDDHPSKDISPHHSTEVHFKNGMPNELEVDLNIKKECELKLLVANDKGESCDIDEAEECFEQANQIVEKENTPIDTENYNLQIPKPTKSQTICNITDVSNCTLDCSPNIDKLLSVSYSDLQKTDELNVVQTSAIIQTENTIETVEAVNFDTKISQVPPNTCDQQINNMSVEGTTCFSSYFQSALNICLKYGFKITYILVIIAAIFVYWLIQSNYIFLAGFLCGFVMLIFMYLLFRDFTTYSIENESIHFPNYKTLPPLVVPVLPASDKESHEGWMNQLIGEYDPETFKLCNTVSVYVSLKGDVLHLSYPKKEIPKRAMWNENLSTQNPFILQNKHILLGAKILLPPDNLLRKRMWAKRFPICIMLARESGMKRSPSVDCSSIIQDKPLPSPVKEPSVQSLPSSLSGSPIHNSQVFYFFARTDREKEEWYWKFKYTLQSQVESPEISHAHSIINSLTNEIKKTISSEIQAEKLKISSQKPMLNFSDYMNFLMKEQSEKLEDEADTPDDCLRLQWLNIFIGRMFFDFLTQEKWHNYMKDKIQYKLSRLKMPQYMHDLLVTDVYLGTSLPQIRRTSQPVLDDRGLWLDLDVEYSGSFQVTLETKIKLQPQIKKSDETGETKEEHIQAPSPVASYDSSRDEVYADLSDDDDDDDLPDSEASRDESPLHSKPSPQQTSTSNRLLLTVERWVSTSQNKFVQKCVGHLTQTPILLTLEMSILCGTVAVNIPPLPTDRIWYGFREKPRISFKVYPKVGERHINYTPITKYIEKKLLLEFEKAIVLPNMDEILVPFMHSPVYGD